MTDTVSIGKWKVPKEMFDKYIKMSDFADGYLDGNLGVPSGINYEKALRWRLCVQEKMKIHREICKHLGLEYSTDIDNEFYRLFQQEIRRWVK